MTIVRALVAAAVTVLALAAPASAGGPTSVLLSVPGQGQTASLYMTDAAYNQLSELVGAYDIPPRTIDDSGAAHEMGTGINVTWLVHDVEPWRVDRIYLSAEGGPWIASQVKDFASEKSIWDSPVVWHQPTQGTELTMLLDRLLDGKAPAPVRDVPEPPAPAPAAAPAEPADSVSGVWWGLGGLLAGALLALGWTRFRPAREDEPELDPHTDWLAPQTRSTSA